jgi:F-type H+-transporting ATPase subunit alpha
VPLPVERQVAIIFAGTNGYLDTLPLSDVRQYEAELYKFMETRHPGLIRSIAEKKQLDDQIKGSLEQAVKEFAGEFAAIRAAGATAA